MTKEWFFDRFWGEQIAIYAEDGKLVDVNVENEREDDLIGSIYKGTVCNVVAGMQAAFVSCGLEKNCYLPLNEDSATLSSYDGEVKHDAPVSLKEGDEILVQIVKPPRGGKGAKVTASLSIVGKHLIYLPRTDFIGISRKITDEAVRERLLVQAEKLRIEGGGLVIRTLAATATVRQLEVEATFLRQMYEEIANRAKSAPVGTVVYRECELPVKVMRDSMDSDVTAIHVGNRGLYEKLVRLARLRGDIDEKIIHLHDGVKSLSREYRLDQQLDELANPLVEIGKGANIVIQQTEGMTVIDVNTAKFVGDADLESTVTRTNILAAREIARQVRLRNLGGIIAVDFIDMAEEEHRNLVFAELESCLMQDRAKCRLQPMNELCVVLFTRQRTVHALNSFLLKPCPHCKREGYVLSDTYMAMRIRGAVSDLFHEGNRWVVVELNHALMESILSEGMFAPDFQTRWKGKRLYLIPHKTYHEEQFSVRAATEEIMGHLPERAQILY